MDKMLRRHRKIKACYTWPSIWCWSWPSPTLRQSTSIRTVAKSRCSSTKLAYSSSYYLDCAECRAG